MSARPHAQQQPPSIPTSCQEHDSRSHRMIFAHALKTQSSSQRRVPHKQNHRGSLLVQLSPLEALEALDLLCLLLHTVCPVACLSLSGLLAPIVVSPHRAFRVSRVEHQPLRPSLLPEGKHNWKRVAVGHITWQPCFLRDFPPAAVQDPYKASWQRLAAHTKAGEVLPGPG